MAEKRYGIAVIDENGQVLYLSTSNTYDSVAEADESYGMHAAAVMLAEDGQHSEAVELVRTNADWQNQQQADNAVRVLATALDNLGARIYRDVHPESSYISTDDEQITDILDKLSAYADEQIKALDHPAVRAVLDGGER